ncbi:MAG: hypothetical protein Q4E57_06575 [Eubacteriales bacterium]|nr:hypothetical protein [Eubacteriales bacterium]
MFIDWVGDQPELLLDTSTGELRKVHIFTTTLGFSSLIYVEIFLDEKLPQFIVAALLAVTAVFLSIFASELSPRRKRHLLKKSHFRSLLSCNFANMYSSSKRIKYIHVPSPGPLLFLPMLTSPCL